MFVVYLVISLYCFIKYFMNCCFDKLNGLKLLLPVKIYFFEVQSYLGREYRGMLPQVGVALAGRVADK